VFRPWRAGIGIESDPWALGLAGAEAARAAMRPIEAGVTIPRRPTALLPDGEPVGLVLANGIFRDMGWPKFALREIEQLLEPHGRLVATCARRPDQPGKSRESSYFHAFLRLCEEGFFIEDVLIGTDYCCYVGRRSRPAENFSAEKQSGRNRGEPHSFGMDAECLLADQEQLAALASSYRSRATGILEARSNGLAAVRQLREREVSESQAESRRLASQLEQLRERESRIEDELRLRLAGVRYRLGDALVRASQRPGDLLRLPARLVRLFREGQRARNTRRRLGMPEQV